MRNRGSAAFGLLLGGEAGVITLVVLPYIVSDYSSRTVFDFRSRLLSRATRAADGR
jgi:hypothetical protein